jgi:hypothetical protein
MVFGLTIAAEGVGNSKGQLEARKISFTPDEFAIEVAEEQQFRPTRRLLKMRNPLRTREWLLRPWLRVRLRHYPSACQQH